MHTQTNDTFFKFGSDYIKEHFGSNVPLATQQITHNLYRSNPNRLVDLIIQCLDMNGDESLLDIGCGNGFVLGEVTNRMKAGGKAVGIDVSPTMLELATQNTAKALIPVDLVQGAAEDLSAYDDGQFQRVMANFIFHYIDDPDLVCSEIARVTNEGGLAIITIEARHSMPEMYNLHFEAMELCDFPIEFTKKLPRGRRGKMVLDNAVEILSKHFDNIVEVPYIDTLVFPTSEPFMNFYATGHRYLGVQAMSGDVISKTQIEKLHSLVDQQIKQKIMETGSFILNKQNSIFICRKNVD